MTIHPALLEIFRHKFAALAEEMGATLTRTAFSPNIKERRDFSCAVFTAEGDMLAQAAHIPVHLGSMPLSVKAALAARPPGRGEMVMLNDPFRGGTHLPDITLLAPVFDDRGRPLFYVANRAHHADVGGVSAGSMPLSTSLFQEGVVIPPVVAVRDGAMVPDLLALFLANVRTPEEREGDFAAQIMANLTGAARLAALLAERGPETTRAYAEALLDHGERLAVAALSTIPEGVYEAWDLLDDDGAGATDIPIGLRLTVAGGRAVFDFRQSAPQTGGCLNATGAITASAALYVLGCLMPPGAPINAGCARAITVLTRPATVVEAAFPAAVAGGNVETSQRLVDVILKALAPALPEIVPAASQGTMNNLAMGGVDPRAGQAFTYYETLAGGHGASARGPGESAMHSHMTNTLNTPIEALEYSYPFLARRYEIRRGSGGAGRERGGDGLIRDIEVLAAAEVTVLSERRARGPYGLWGGGDGAPGVNALARGGVTEIMPGKFHARLEPGDRVRLMTPGGGGFGPAVDGPATAEPVVDGPSTAGLAGDGGGVGRGGEG